MKPTWKHLFLLYLSQLFGLDLDQSGDSAEGLGASSSAGPESLSQLSQLSDKDLLSLAQLKAQLRDSYFQSTRGHKGNWPSDKDCDSALWAGVARAAGIEEVQVDLALTWEGRPTRLPCGDCGPGSHGYNNGSAATTSTDMMLGTILGLFCAKDRVSLEKMRSYADENRGIMGVPRELVARTWIKPGTRAFLSQAIGKLGGKKDNWALLGQLHSPNQEDYQLHLQLLSFYFESLLLDGNLSKSNRKALEKEADRNPEDALAQALAGNRKKATELLLNPAWKVPGYVRGPETAKEIHQLLIIQILLAGR